MEREKKKTLLSSQESRCTRRAVLATLSDSCMSLFVLMWKSVVVTFNSQDRKFNYWSLVTYN